MSRRYFIDTCVWMTRFYHIDGLRLDLMGILSIDLVNEIYLRCRSINPDFMVYGEGWDMPSFCLRNSAPPSATPESCRLSLIFRTVSAMSSKEAPRLMKLPTRAFVPELSICWIS